MLMDDPAFSIPDNVPDTDCSTLFILEFLDDALCAVCPRPSASSPFDDKTIRRPVGVVRFPFPHAYPLYIIVNRQVHVKQNHQEETGYPPTWR